MKHTTMTRLLRRSALVVALLGLLAGTGSAYDLVADQFSWNGITMWGFAEDTGQACGAGGTWAPGPVLEALQGDTLTVNLRNCLTVPVSIVIPGLEGALAPQTVGADSRIRAFTNETTVGGSAVYTWAAKAGTYLYHSGSDLATQVHMGLYGALVVDSAAGEAYPGVFYDIDVVLLASEVDPARHDPAIGETRMATPLTYRPKYFLANGLADGSTALGDTTDGPFVNDRVLFRFVNAGLFNYVPTLLGEDMVFVAEDGNPYNYPVSSYGELLPAGKTMDALWTPVSAGAHALYDRRLHMSSDGVPGGGLVATVNVFAADVPTANAGDELTGVAPGSLVTLTGSAIGGTAPYTYDWALVAFPAGSTAWLATGECSFDLILCSADVSCAVDTCVGGFCSLGGGACLGDTDCTQPNDCTPFTPTIAGGSDVKFTVDEPGAYTARLVVTDFTGANSAPDSVNVFTNRPPVAIAIATSPVVNQNESVTLDGNDSYDPDGDPITSYAWQVTAPDLTFFGLTGATPTFTASQVGDYLAELTVSDGSLNGTDSVTVTAVTPANHPPVAVEDFGQVTWWTNNNNGPTTVSIDVVLNDTDPDCGDTNTCIVRGSVGIVTPPSNGTIVSVVNGVVTYSPTRGWRGSDYFSYQVCDDGSPEVPPAPLCATGAVQVNVTK